MKLSPRERETCQLMAIECLRDKEIARRMHVSPRTVETNVHHALKKLGLRNRLELCKHIVTDHVRAA